MRRVVLLAVAVVACACRADPARVVSPDTSAPQVRIVFPVGVFPFDSSSTWDRDSNGLLEIEIAWSDSGGVVDLASLRITSLAGIPGAPTDTNLAKGWRLVRLDATGALFEETVALMLRSGVNNLKVQVADTAGNRGTDSIRVVVPPGAFNRSIDLAYRPEWPQVRGVNLLLSPNASKGLVAFSAGRVAVFDPEGQQPTRYVENVPNSGLAAGVSLDPFTGRVFIAGGGQPTAGFTVFDLGQEAVVDMRTVGGSAASVHVAADRLLVGQACTDGRILLFDRVTLASSAQVPVGATNITGACPNAASFAAATNGRLAWASVVDHGIYEFDTQSLAVTRHFDVRPPAQDGDFGGARDILLLADRWLYAAKTAEGLDEIDLMTGSVSGHYPASGPVNPSLRELALSPGGGLLFVTGSPDATGSPSIRAPLLFDVPGLRLRFAYPPRTGAIHDAAVFHPDGKRVYVMAQFRVDVYLVRPD